MKKTTTILLGLLFVAFGVSVGSAAVITLVDYSINADDSFSTPLGLDPSTGIGTISLTMNGAGSHYVGGFFDLEIDEKIDTFFNEYGSTAGTEAAGQSWEIDEPGYVFGDIWANFTSNPLALDNLNGVPAATPDDVSVALGWDFTLLSNQTAYLSFVVSETAPGSGFFLTQYDPDSGASIYFSSTLDIRTHGVPEPGTVMLLGTGLVGLLGWGRRRAIF